MLSLDKILADAVARGVAPGMAAGVLRPDGERAVAVAGARSVITREPIDDDTIFYVASCSKLVTSIAALQLVERGVLKLDDPVGGLLKQLDRPELLLGFADSGEPLTRIANRKITLRHLLTHTSGVGYDWTSAELTRFVKAEGLDMRQAEPPSLPLLFEPGENWIYGMGHDWAGRLIEAATGEGLDAYCKKNIFDPLGMTETTFFPSDEQTSRRAAVHFHQADGSFDVIPFGMPASRHFWMGGAGLYSTVNDYLTLLTALVRRNEALLDNKSYAALSCDFVNQVDAGWITSADPSMSFDYRPLSGVDRRHGLAGLVNLQPLEKGRHAGSLHWAGATNCYFWADLEAQAAGILMSQVLPFAEPGLIEVFKQVETATYV